MQAVVTGGGGFLGRRIVGLLRDRGDDVRVIERRTYPALEAGGASVFVADIRNPGPLRAAFRGADVVYHVAGRVGLRGARDAFWSVNVEGTRAVLEAARQSGVPRLVYTSTPSVVGYDRDVENGGPDLPYADVHESAYAESKCKAERLVLAANGSGIATVALRPHVIFGPGDERLLLPVIRRAGRGRLRIIGDGSNHIDLTYVDNAAWAHLDAARALTSPAADCAGRPYFISNGEPVLLWQWINELLQELDLPMVTQSLSFRSARAVGKIAEALWRIAGLRSDPPFTGLLASVLARSHWYDIGPARRDLGYQVRVPMQEATRQTVQWLAERYWLDARRSASRHARSTRRRKTDGKERLNYYITPTHDFKQYTKDYEQKYWSQDTAFDWHQDVAANLKAHVDTLSADAFAKVAWLALPLVAAALDQRIREVRRNGLPLDEDGLKLVGESLPADPSTIDAALVIQAPLEQLDTPATSLRDQLAILRREWLEVDGHRRVGLVKSGTRVRRPASEAESKEQAAHLASLMHEIKEKERALRAERHRGEAERARLQVSIRTRLNALEPQALAELVEARELVRRTLQSKCLPRDERSASRLRTLVWKRQLRGLKDIANHALVVEQSAIAPLTMGVIHYKRRREIQEAMTTFVNDEAKHSAVFRRFMAQKLEAKERIPEAILKGAQRYMWLARLMPSGGIYLAVIVEAIGAAYLEFFGQEEHMPDPLFRSICKTISGRDEKRHMDLCTATYNELYRTGTRWELLRNNVALRVMMKSAYGDKNEDHSLLQACRAFGIEADRPYQYVSTRLSHQLARIGMHVEPDHLLAFMQLGRRVPNRP